MVVPFVPMFMARVTCTHCGRDTVGTRAAFKVGMRRVCEHCGKLFTVQEIRSLASPGRGKAPTKSTKRR